MVALSLQLLGSGVDACKREHMASRETWSTQCHSMSLIALLGRAHPPWMQVVGMLNTNKSTRAAMNMEHADTLSSWFIYLLQVMADMDQTLGPIPAGKHEIAAQAIGEIYGSTRMMLACLPPDLLHKVRSTKPSSAAGCMNVWGFDCATAAAMCHGPWCI